MRAYHPPHYMHITEHSSINVTRHTASFQSDERTFLSQGFAHFITQESDFVGAFLAVEVDEELSDETSCCRSPRKFDARNLKKVLTDKLAQFYR